MLILCQKHGPSSGLLVSPDVAAAIASDGEPLPIRELVYLIEGEAFHRYTVSKQFAVALNLQDQEFGNLDLPDDYPNWQSVLVPNCERCFDEFYGT